MAKLSHGTAATATADATSPRINTTFIPDPSPLAREWIRRTHDMHPLTLNCRKVLGAAAGMATFRAGSAYQARHVTPGDVVCCAGRETLARAAGVSVRSVQRAINEAVAAGLERRRSTFTSVLVFPPLVTPVGTSVDPSTDPNRAHTDNVDSAPYTGDRETAPRTEHCRRGGRGPEIGIRNPEAPATPAQLKLWRQMCEERGLGPMSPPRTRGKAHEWISGIKAMGGRAVKRIYHPDAPMTEPQRRTLAAMCHERHVDPPAVATRAEASAWIARLMQA